MSSQNNQALMECIGKCAHKITSGRVVTFFGVNQPCLIAMVAICYNAALIVYHSDNCFYIFVTIYHKKSVSNILPICEIYKGLLVNIPLDNFLCDISLVLIEHKYQTKSCFCRSFEVQSVLSLLFKCPLVWANCFATL